MSVKLPSSWRRLNTHAKTDARRRQRLRFAVRARATGAAKGSERGHAALEPIESARLAGLRYVSDRTTPGIRRLGSKTRVRYVTPDGRTVSDAAELRRIRSLVVRPAWTDVWICPNPQGHLQATGRDARGRKQYRYHPRWREVRDEVKYGCLLAFSEALPPIRARTSIDLLRTGLPREKVLATVVQLLEKTFIRVGNEEYARQNGSVGLTTMRDAHAKIKGSRIRFEFRGKSGVGHAVDFEDRRLAAIIKSCRDLPGYELFQYVDDDGVRRSVDSADVNAYLREIGRADFTAKDFRTWAGTVLAARALVAIGGFESKRQAAGNVLRAVETVADRLGNTTSVCRKCYIHPAILDAYMDGATIQTVRVRGRRNGRSRPLGEDERAVVRLIERYLPKAA